MTSLSMVYRINGTLHKVCVYLRQIIKKTNVWSQITTDECYKNEQTFECYNICSCPTLYSYLIDLINIL